MLDLRSFGKCSSRENTEITVIYERGGCPLTTMKGENCERRGRKAESTRDRGKEEEGSRYRTYGLCSH